MSSRKKEHFAKKIPEPAEIDGIAESSADGSWMDREKRRPERFKDAGKQNRHTKRPPAGLLRDAEGRGGRFGRAGGTDGNYFLPVLPKPPEPRPEEESS